MVPASTARVLLWIQLATTLPLAGLIATIQWVHYPLFAAVGAEAFPAYHAAHSRLITPLVAPLMMVELAAAGLMWLQLVARPGEPGVMSVGLASLGLALVLLAWGVTGLLSVPAHGVLAQGFDAAAHARLVSTNYLRVLAWVGRSALLLWVAWRLR